MNPVLECLTSTSRQPPKFSLEAVGASSALYAALRLSLTDINVAGARVIPHAKPYK